MSSSGSNVVAVIGAGPVGLAAAAHLLKYQQPFVVLEAGADAGAAVREWGHVRTFSPWRYMIDGAARELLESAGWPEPSEDHLPTGHELVDQYVVPLANHAAIRPHVRYNARVVAVSRKDFGMDAWKSVVDEIGSSPDRSREKCSASWSFVATSPT